jgi:type IV fimbrial biogenesis protein FimT
MKTPGLGHHARGVTLIEACVVVALSAILLASATPDMRRFIDGQRLRSLADRLAIDLQFARIESVARGQPLRLTLHGDGEASCYLLHTGSASQCRCDAAGQARCDAGAEAIKAVTVPAADRMSLGANVGSMVFDPVFGTVTPTGTWRISAADGRAIHHVVNLIGRVRSCSPQGAIAGYPAC